MSNHTTELVPKFEILVDRLEMTLAEYIHPGEELEDHGGVDGEQVG